MATANRKPLGGKEYKLLHVQAGDLEVPVWVDIVNKLSVKIFLVHFSKGRYVRAIPSPGRRIPLRSWKTVHISAIGRMGEISTSAAVASEDCTVLEPSN